MGIASAAPAIWGGIKVAGSWLAQQAAKEGVKLAAKEGAKALIGAAVSKGIEKVTEDEQQPQTFDEKAANKKAALKAAAGARKRISQQTQTLLTSPLGGAGATVAKTLLGQ